MIEAKILADSLNPATGNRLTTYLLRYPRFIHSELMTHRAFSRNASSSRAIPVDRMIRMIEEEPAEPVEWGANQRGMQARKLLQEQDAWLARERWLKALDDAVHNTRRLLDLGVHKQIANRLLEPWAHMTTLVSSTEWGNFFRLRAHADAAPEFRDLARSILRLYLDSEPVQVREGEWHLPFRHPDDVVLTEEQMVKVAVARCARTSYLTFDGEHSIEKDIELHDRLLLSGHFSPFEHVARPYPRPTWSGNFCGWRQYRQMVEPLNQQLPPSRRELEEIYARSAPVAATAELPEAR